MISKILPRKPVEPLSRLSSNLPEPITNFRDVCLKKRKQLKEWIKDGIKNQHYYPRNDKDNPVGKNPWDSEKVSERVIFYNQQQTIRHVNERLQQEDYHFIGPPQWLFAESSFAMLQVHIEH